MYTLGKTWVYVLSCKGGKYYIGFSKNLHERLVNHFAGHGAIFTKLNPPEHLLLYKPGDKREEYRIWCYFATKFGLRLVGGYNEALALMEGFPWPFEPQLQPIPRAHLMRRLQHNTF